MGGLQQKNSGSSDGEICMLYFAMVIVKYMMATNLKLKKNHQKCINTNSDPKFPGSAPLLLPEK